MGIEEFLLDQAKKEGLKEGLREGLKKGMNKKNLEKNLEFTKSLLLSTDLVITKIAVLVGVSEDFVSNVKNDLLL